MSSLTDMLISNIRYLMYRHDISSFTELAKRLKMPQSTMHRISVGEIKDPKYSTLKQIADYFGVSAIDLIECDLQNTQPTTVIEVEGEYYPHTYPQIPIRNDVTLSDEDNNTELKPSENNGYLRWPSHDVNAYAVKCTGASLMPRIKEGEFVVVEPSHEVTPGDEVLIITIDGKVTVKTFIFERDGNLHLIPVNEDHAPTRLPKNDIETLHYVAGIAKPDLIKH
ncbi:S24 family peptidase [Xenorhabdus innexi]|uniref:Phage repressor protein n=1 Tax=Xenorhabdus innexi TaxID=290109 RepID=A0A1N6MWT7_9GAMM|nr:S24 family peptidase [Xenorhabdus innexi]PHM33306.1 phage repressor protein [Xenorhabdus innexi]SIP73296.1 Predicted phage repressor [Xenorhabdus innexi]